MQIKIIRRCCHFSSLFEYQSSKQNRHRQSESQSRARLQFSSALHKLSFHTKLNHSPVVPVFLQHLIRKDVIIVAENFLKLFRCIWVLRYDMHTQVGPPRTLLSLQYFPALTFPQALPICIRHFLEKFEANFLSYTF